MLFELNSYIVEIMQLLTDSLPILIMRALYASVCTATTPNPLWLLPNFVSH